ncbi:MAG: DUF2142 domain-containing protein [Ilumatobacteraceae bacterium]
MPDAGAIGTHPQGRLSQALTALGRRWFVVHIALVGAMFVLWALASPPSSVPDEPHHIVKAASIWQGQLQGPTQPLDPENIDPSITAQLLRTPASYAAINEASCYAFRSEVPATCIPDITDSGDIVGSLSAAGPYPPTFYALVGWPTRFVRAEVGIYLMRLTSAALCLGLAALALHSLRRRVGDILALVAVTVALTPEVGYLAGSVNPNGLEILGGLAMWAGLAAAVGHRLAHEAVPRLTTVTALAGAAGLALTRSLGPFFAAAVAAAVIVAHGRPVLTLRRDRTLLRLLGGIGALVVAGTTWVLYSGHLSSVPGGAPQTGTSVMQQLVERIDDWAQQMVAVFGWLDTGPVLTTVWAWLAIVAGLVTVVWVTGRSWLGTCTVLLVGIVAITPVIIQYPGAAEQGIAWQGRYGLALAMGIPVFAVLALAERSRPLAEHARLVTFVTALAAIGQVAGFATAMRRYAVGLPGPLRFWKTPGAWSPPLGNLLTLVLFTGVCFATVGVAVAVGSISRQNGTAADP